MTDDEKRELADVYEKAAEYLEKYGWIQGKAGKDGQPRCFMGALASATMRNPHLFGLMSKSERFAMNVMELEDNHKSDECAMAEWNDEEGRTEDEVINTLHALANKLR